MGKKAVPVAYLVGDQNRRNTFKKRLWGLMKKAHDLSILCGAQIAMIVVDESGEISPYTRNESIEEVWAHYDLESSEIKRTRLLDCKRLLEIETKKAKVACQAKKDTNQEPQDCGLHSEIDWNNMFIMQHNQTNQGITNSTMQYQPNASNAMMTCVGPNMNNGRDSSCMRQEQINTSGPYIQNTIINYNGNSNQFLQEQQTQYQGANVYVENQQHGVDNVYYGVGNQQGGMETHQNQGVGAHQQQHGAYQGNGANLQHTHLHIFPNETNGTHQNQLVGAHQQQHGAYQGNGANLQHTNQHISPHETNGLEEEWPTTTNPSLSDFDPEDWGPPT